MLADSSKANLRRMQVSLNRINRLIDDIVELFKINAATQPSVPVDLNNVLGKVKQNFHRKISERSVTIDAAGLPVVTGIPDMIQLLFQNLIDNSIKFQQEGKPPMITIAARDVRMDTKSHEPDPKGDLYQCITFTDNGIGIPTEDQSKIFGMFVQLHEKKKFPGSGLGLTFSQKIMETHGGFMKVESTENVGSVFSCYFPNDASGN